MSREEKKGLRILRQDILHYLERHEAISPVINQVAESLRLMLEGQIILLEYEEDEEGDEE